MRGLGDMTAAQVNAASLTLPDASYRSQSHRILRSLFGGGSSILISKRIGLGNNPSKEEQRGS